MKHILSIIACSALLSSCHLYTNYERSQGLTEGIDNLYRDTSDGKISVNNDTLSFGNLPWQEVFTDSQLQILINKALNNNTNLRSADLTIQQAQQGLKVARLAYLPSLSFSPQGTLSSWDFNKATKTYSVPLAASWQANLPSLRNSKKQSEVSVQIAEASKQATRTSIIANVANLYYTLQMLDEQLKTTQATADIWAENVRAMELMKEAAMTNEAAVGQAKANYYSLLSSIPALKESIIQTENALCVILHEAPHAIERNTFDADKFPQSYSTGIPLQLLRSRPDVYLSEMQLASCFYGVNIAKSAFYPTLNITAQGAWTNNAGSAIVNPGKILASLVGSLTQPLFAKGQLRANLKISQLQYEDAELQFEQTLLNAGQDVSNALASYNSACQQQETCQRQVEILTTTLENTKQLFQYSTSTTYLETLTAQQSLIQAQLTLIQNKFDKVQAAIDLYQALGGGREETLISNTNYTNNSINE